jgi:hypothetical protein
MAQPLRPTDDCTMQTCCNYDVIQCFVHPCLLTMSGYTGKERDTESGLDYFGARYYASNMGVGCRLIGVVLLRQFLMPI